jgi:hypothetical protein
MNDGINGTRGADTPKGDDGGKGTRQGVRPAFVQESGEPSNCHSAHLGRKIEEIRNERVEGKALLDHHRSEHSSVDPCPS